jgi:ATP-dependent Clp protease ATP-binding subunit ClpA
LDEIEKANERVLDIFLQVLDEGFLHDAFGRKVNFETMIIIATSNAGALTIKKMVEIGINPADMEKKVIDSVMEDKVFRPEFINRFDDVVIFAPLANEDVLRVTQLLLDKFAQQVSGDQDITLEFASDVAAQVVARGFDPVFGARSLHHYIDNVIADVLAKKMIKGNVRRGEKIYFVVDDMNI